MQGRLVLLLVAAIAAATPLGAQGRGGSAAGGGRGFQCQGCDSAQIATARQRWVDSEISALTLELARRKFLLENLESRLAPDSKEPPRSERERAEMQAQLKAQSTDMNRLVRELSARCGEQEPVRGHIGVVTEQTMTAETGPSGRSTTTLSYHVVSSVTPDSPASRAGIAPGDTIIAINRADARVRSLAPFIREPGTKLSLTISRDGTRRDLTVTVAQKPPTFDGACMQYREYRFLDPNGRNVVMYRGPGSVGAVGGIGTGGSTARAGVGGTGQGGVVRARVGANGQPVPIVLSPDSAGTSTFIMVPPASVSGALYLSRGGSAAVVAGAEVSMVNGPLKTIFAVDHGALVTNVLSRSPAEQAGIISGDVIVKANGENVTTVSVLQRAIMAANEKHSVTLDVIRAKQPRQITLRW